MRNDACGQRQREPLPRAHLRHQLSLPHPGRPASLVLPVCLRGSGEARERDVVGAQVLRRAQNALLEWRKPRGAPRCGVGLLADGALDRLERFLGDLPRLEVLRKGEAGLGALRRARRVSTERDQGMGE